ncbi:ECF transporter S component [Gudongella sp. DL1XJH-153]|uniref:ECF transporter S component n=1 Tax=Gudongella sp. DL1XJH-153 TaxID=3409804 RepID=UPI003BB72082
MKSMKRFDIRKLTIIGVLGAISIVLGMTPLGFIPVGPTRATIMHIPVIIGAIIEGPIVGALVGLIFGLFSIYQAITAPTPVSFVFLNPIVSVLPRILIGITAYYTFKGLNSLGSKRTIGLLYVIWAAIIIYLSRGIYLSVIDYTSIWPLLMNVGLLILTIGMVYLTAAKFKDKALDIVIATIVGTLTNTVGVLTMIYVFFGERFVEALGQDVEVARRIIVGIGITNGIPESIIAIIIVTSVVSAVKRRR